jgi:hypothetical protein
LFRHGGRPRRSFLESIVVLLFHLLGTTVIFVSLIALTWVTSWVPARLNEIHPFPVEILPILHRFEIGLTYFDQGLCAILLFAGAWRFVVELFEDRYD